MKRTLIFTLLLLIPLATAIDYLPNNALNPSGAPINTAIVPSDDPVWSYESNGLYKAHFMDDSSSGQIVRFQSGGAYMTLQPMALNWRNDLNQLEQINMVQSVAGTADGDTMRYLGAYGPTTHLEYIATDTQLKQNIKLENQPPAPAQYIIDGGNAALETNFIFGTNAFTIEINGEEWDKKTATGTSSSVSIKNSDGDTLYTLPPPIAIDADGDTITGTYHFKKSGVSLYISHHTPKAWLDTATYPVNIDPTFQVDYSPVPAINLLGANVLTQNNTNFINIDVTSAVSDSSDATSITLYKEQALPKIEFYDKDSDDYTDEVEYDDQWFTDEFNVKKIADAAEIVRTTGTFQNGMKLRFRLELKEKNARGMYYLTNIDDTVTYGSFSMVGEPILTELERNVTLTNISTSVSRLYLHGKDLSGDKKTYYELVELTDPENASAFTGHWTQTYNPISNWFLKVRKISSGTTTTVTYAYENNQSFVQTENTTYQMNGIGWFYIPIDDLMDYEYNTAGMNFTSVRFVSDDSARFSEFLLMEEVNDTAAPIITNCTVNTSELICGETARFNCHVTDDNGVDNVVYTINSVEYDAMQDNDDWYVDFSPIGYATTNYTLTLVNATDINGKSNTTNPSLSVLYNCTLPPTPPPVISNCTVVPNNITCNESTIYSCTVTGNYSIHNVDFIINNITYTGTEGLNNTWYTELTLNGEGTASYTLTLVNATDILAQNNYTITNLTAYYNCTTPPQVNTTMSCLYNPQPYTSIEQGFICDLYNADNKTFNCYGITKHPDDGSIFDITPRQELVDQYGTTTGYEATPALAPLQMVKVSFSKKRLTTNQPVVYEALCINDQDATDQVSFNVTLTPRFTQPDVIGELAYSGTSNAGYYVMLLGGLFLGLLILFMIVRELRRR